MSDNKGYETMRDLVRALQQTEYGLRTGILSPDDLDSACDNSRMLYERLVVIRHKAREARVHEQAKTSVVAEPEPSVAGPVKEMVAEAPKPAPEVKKEVVAEAPKPAPEVKKEVAAELPKPVVEPLKVAEPRKEVVANVPAPEPTKTPEVKKEVVTVEPEQVDEPVKAAEPKKELVAEAPAPEPPKAPEVKKDVVVQAVKPTPPVTKPEPVVKAPQPVVKLETRPQEQKQPAVAATTETATEVAEASTAQTAAEFLAAFRASTVPKPTRTVADKLEQTHIDDLLKAINVNDRFWYTKELFNGEKPLFEKSIAQMNAASSLDEAIGLLNKSVEVDPGRPANAEARKALVELVHRRFA